jgi:magnesium transporter
MGHALAHLSEDRRQRILTTLRPEGAAGILDEIPDAQARELVESLRPEAAAAIVVEMPSDEQADLIGSLESEYAAAILENMEPAQADELRVLVEYPNDVAGGLMVTELLRFIETETIGDVISTLQSEGDKYRDFDVQYSYVVSVEGRLIGVLRLRSLLLATPAQPISSVMIASPLSVPVDVESAMTDRADNDYLKSQGIVAGEELRTMPILRRCRRRLGWLSINVLLNIMAASVIALYQDTLSAVIALAVFLPIISDMSGCSGNQAVAVSIRELALGLIQPKEAMRVWGREIVVGAINGTVLGLIIAGAAWLWKGNVFLGLAVGIALALNTVISVSIGGCVPLVLKRFNIDPALASGPVLTTVTDICGFFLVLGLATLWLARMVV